MEGRTQRLGHRIAGKRRQGGGDAGLSTPGRGVAFRDYSRKNPALQERWGRDERRPAGCQGGWAGLTRPGRYA